ncbi:MAG TPA: hypothetical protein ENH59_09810 [Bacteroidetes bacterium]|nr:hypothetical protein [Bacteroidota bacterium]
MKRTIKIYLSVFMVLIIVSSCLKKDEGEINYETGFFPEETYNLEGINSAWDDFNVALPQLAGELPVMFSSNRNSQGSHFNIITGFIYFAFSQVDAGFCIESFMFHNSFYEGLEDKVNTDRDELGPYRLFNSENGLEYFFYAGANTSGSLNLKYLYYSPANPDASLFGQEPADISALNSDSNDAYICFDSDFTTVYLTNDSDGNFDIKQAEINKDIQFDAWLKGDPVSLSVTDSVNSVYDDKCPFVRDSIMVFTSDRPGGLGGFDLYYSVFRDGKWSSPYNMGPEINTEHNEYRPLIGSCPGFGNHFLLFSSDRPSGLGGYDLYLRGIDLGVLAEGS